MELDLSISLTQEEIKNCLIAIKAKEILANKKGRELPTVEKLEFSTLVSQLFNITSTDDTGDVVKFLNNIREEGQKVVDKLNKF
jgi:hypothetical protein